MPYMTRILSDLQAFFPRVDTVPGWETRGSSSFAPAGVVCHWTAGPLHAAVGTRPSLSIVVNGRPDLNGPLCNVYLDRAGIPVIVAAGRANHAGTGGWAGLVGNSAVYGIEAESGGDDDWTPQQREAYPRLVKALMKGLNRNSDTVCGHHEWAPTRKIDIRDWNMTDFRRSVTLASPLTQTPTDPAPTTLAPTPEEETMLVIRRQTTGVTYMLSPGRISQTDALEDSVGRYLLDPAGDRTRIVEHLLGEDDLNRALQAFGLGPLRGAWGNWSEMDALLPGPRQTVVVDPATGRATRY